MKYADRMRFASLVSKAAQEWLAGGLEAFRGDAKMIKAYRSDAADLREVAGLLRAGKVEKAVEKGMGLDTVVRDCIPNEVYEAFIDVEEATYAAKKSVWRLDFTGATVVFTGFRDPSLQRAIESRGGRVVSAVSNKTDVLVAYDPTSASGKAEKARDLGVPVVSYLQAQDAVGM